MKKFFVIGNKTSKSLSPLIFNYWFKKYKIKAKYGYIELKNSTFDKKIKEILKDHDLCGLNITIPFKKKIMKHTNVFDKHSKKINAVNCISIKKNKIKGINTDWKGYFKSLPNKHNLKKQKTIIIGYGGAALAIHYVLQSKGFQNVLIFNRSRKKLRFTKVVKYTKNINLLEKHLSSAKFIINTIPINILKKNSAKLINSTALLSDIIYKPKETNLLRLFPKNKKVYGIQMLLEQAKLSFDLWFGFVPEIDKKLLEALEKKIK